MPPLTEAQTRRIGTTLTTRNQTLREEIRAKLTSSGKEEYEDLAGAVRDAGDEAVADLLRDVTLHEVARDVRELREVEAAQRRLATGTYGTCADCGKEIDARRLEVHPAALRCMTCQELHDRTHAHANVPRL